MKGSEFRSRPKSEETIKRPAAFRFSAGSTKCLPLPSLRHGRSRSVGRLHDVGQRIVGALLVSDFNCYVFERK